MLPFTATKSKETRNKILAQENTKDSGMRYLAHDFSRLVASYDKAKSRD